VLLAPIIGAWSRRAVQERRRASRDVLLGERGRVTRIRQLDGTGRRSGSARWLLLTVNEPGHGVPGPELSDREPVTEAASTRQSVDRSFA
jgi:hypothetical protein